MTPALTRRHLLATAALAALPSLGLAQGKLDKITVAGWN